MLSGDSTSARNQPTDAEGSSRRRRPFFGADAPGLPATALSPRKIKKASSTPETLGIESLGEPQGRGLMDLPPEIHLLISQQLIYPDALSLKHTCQHFYGLVDTGVGLKVEWLMQRRSLHLECPNNTRCDLGSDLRFCRGSVALLMQRRREHMECESRPGVGCLVYDTSVCTHRRRGTQLIRHWLRRRLTIELWWLLLAAIPVLFCWLWLAEMVAWAGHNNP